MKKTVQEKKLVIDVTTVRKLASELSSEQLKLANGAQDGRTDGCGGSRAGIC